MNDFPSLPERDLPGRGFPERDLPAGRRALLKEHLLNEIRQEATRSAQPRPARRKWLRPAFAGPALAGTLALAVVGGVALMGGDGGGTGAPGGQAVPQGAPQSAAQLLDRVATVASKEDLGELRDDQYAYIKTKAAWGESEMCSPLKLGPVREREAWVPVSADRAGVFRTDAGKPVESMERPTPGIPSNTYYRHLETLPTDPDKMLDWLHKASEGGKSEDQNTFTLVGDLVRESLVPPKVAAALYRAAAKIPGVELVPNATDAIGRKGIAVGRIDEQSGHRQELIFDKTSYTYLGERGVLTKDGDGGSVTEADGTEKQCPGTPAGTVTANTAVLERKVVDSAPKAQPGVKEKDHPADKEAAEKEAAPGEKDAGAAGDKSAAQESAKD
ncbi:anti-sigma factor [Streptomyces sp. TRM66268-LWL]|uniref:Anti-sigma factor n=1 Tax=Streptomyces polyasparticus TaxID=2767826 RepID=A0ABR7SV35_9ACTN|nr:CU044_5270 family protein [Streptomyces polyasparticus]MBC9718659.1 anti-sigma factor [Streptomyces polyasparticus]